MLYKSKKFRDLCRGQKCYAMIPGVCMGQDDTVVPAHSPNVDHVCGVSGVGQKVSDAQTAPICVNCHDAIDNRTTWLIPSERQYYWNKAYFRWINDLMVSGRLVVK
jgi:hypothetical protein